MTPRTVEGRYHWGGVQNEVTALSQSRCITACRRIYSGLRRSSQSGSLPNPRTRCLLRAERRAYYRSVAGIKFEFKLELGWLGGKVAKDFVSQLGRLCVEVHHGAYQGSPGYFVYDAFAALWLAFIGTSRTCSQRHPRVGPRHSMKAFVEFNFQRHGKERKLSSNMLTHQKVCALSLFLLKRRAGNSDDYVVERR